MSIPNISYTLLSCYKRCRQRCKLQYFDKVLPYDKVNHRPFIVGIVVDKLFEKWIEEQHYREDWMEDSAEGLFNWYAKKRHIIYLNSDDKRKLIFKTKNAARRLQDYAFNLDFPNRDVRTQLKREFNKYGVTLVVKLDLWFPNEREIMDLKITESARYLDPMQLRFYALVLGEMGFDIEKLSFLSPLMKKAYREVSWTAEDKDDIFREVSELVELLKKRAWGRTADDCWGCPVVAYCEADFDVDKEERTEGGGFRIDF